jgi:uncharacterized protein (DUF1697 family)
MQVIRTIFESLGFSKVQTFIASGNIIFESKSTPTESLEKRIESGLKKQLGYSIGALVRTEQEVLRIAEFMPFAKVEVESALSLSITFLAEPLSNESHERLMSLKSDLDNFHIEGKHIYWITRTRFSESKIASKVSRILGDRATARGLRTVKQIAEKYCLLDPDDS